ncbi:hypothetical protein BDR05DRAFT_1048354 [Suillus weaverae]|nr:hypothetical protein BDR05DRAFT_1048354 [Suillus weaverae]
MTSYTRTVVVLGGSYRGSRAAQVLAEGLPQGWRVVLVDRNSDYGPLTSVDPQTYESYAVLAGHEHKAFIPYNHIPSSSLSDLPSSSSHVRVPLEAPKRRQSEVDFGITRNTNIRRNEARGYLIPPRTPETR